MNSLRITGRGGAVRWGYRTVATLGAWSYDNGTVTAEATDCDEMGIDQDPLVVTVPVGQREWRWPVRHLVRDGLTVTVTVGPME